MAGLLIQFVTLLVFIFGIILGEVLAHRAFGMPRDSRVMLLDIIIIVFIITVFYSYVGFYETGPVYYVTNFLFGTVSVLATRAALWAGGLTRSETMKPNQAVEVIRALARNGLEAEDIRGVLRQMGLNQKAVDRYGHLIERAVPPYMPRVARMEKALGDLEKRLRALERAIPKGRTAKTGKRG